MPIVPTNWLQATNGSRYQNKPQHDMKAVGWLIEDNIGKVDDDFMDELIDHLKDISVKLQAKG